MGLLPKSMLLVPVILWSPGDMKDEDYNFQHKHNNVGASNTETWHAQKNTIYAWICMNISEVAE